MESLNPFGDMDERLVICNVDCPERLLQKYDENVFFGSSIISTEHSTNGEQELCNKSKGFEDPSTKEVLNEIEHDVRKDEGSVHKEEHGNIEDSVIISNDEVEVQYKGDNNKLIEHCARKEHGEKEIDKDKTDHIISVNTNALRTVKNIIPRTLNSNISKKMDGFQKLHQKCSVIVENIKELDVAVERLRVNKDMNNFDKDCVSPLPKWKKSECNKTVQEPKDELPNSVRIKPPILMCSTECKAITETSSAKVRKGLNDKLQYGENRKLIKLKPSWNCEAKQMELSKNKDEENVILPVHQNVGLKNGEYLSEFNQCDKGDENLSVEKFHRNCSVRVSRLHCSMYCTLRQCAVPLYPLPRYLIPTKNNCLWLPQEKSKIRRKVSRKPKKRNAVFQNQQTNRILTRNISTSNTTRHLVNSFSFWKDILKNCMLKRSARKSTSPYKISLKRKRFCRYCQQCG